MIMMDLAIIDIVYVYFTRSERRGLAILKMHIVWQIMYLNFAQVLSLMVAIKLYICKLQSFYKGHTSNE